MSYLKQQQKIEIAVCIMNCVFRLGCSNQKEIAKKYHVCQCVSINDLKEEYQFPK